MILQVAADTGKVEQRPDADRVQVIGRSDARQHQELWRVDGAARQDDLAAAARDLVLALVTVAHAHRHVLVEDDALDLRVGDHVHVVPVARDGGMQVGARRAPALPVLLGDLVVADAFLDRAVEVRHALVTGLFAGREERIVDLERIGLVGDVEQAAGTVKLVAAALVVLRLLEERQHVVEAPAFVAELAPVIVVPGVAAHVQHRVDRRGATEGLAARPIHAPVVAMRLGCGLVAPVVRRFVAQAREAGRHLQHKRVVGGARLEDQDAQPIVFGEAVGDRAAGRAGADDDVVVGPGHDLLPRGVCSRSR